MSIPDEPQKYRPESLPEQVRRVVRENPLPSWVRWHWAPLGLLAAYAGLGVMVRLSQDYLQRIEMQDVYTALWGILVSNLIVCACWAAWAPSGVIWRLPLALAAATMLAMVGLAGDNRDPWTPLLFSFVFFVAFVLIFASARWGMGCQLVDVSGHNTSRGGRFNIRYLLIITTLGAAVMTFGRLFISDIRGFGEFVLNSRTFVGVLIIPFSLYFFSQVPAAFAFLCPLLPRARWLLMLLVTPLLVAGINYTAARFVIANTQSITQPINEIWRVAAAMSGGASVWMMVSGVVLRWGGYRLAWGKTDDA